MVVPARHTTVLLLVYIVAALGILSTTTSTQAFVLMPPGHGPSNHRTSICLRADASISAPPSTVNDNDNSDDGDNDEYEYLEYDALTEAEFVGSEWLVGTNWDRNPEKIEETWVRLVVSEEGKNICYWGDNSEGKWSLDVASQFLSISKESWFGKQIWAGVVDDYYFLQGTVRGWTYLQPASVLAQWQAKRLGVDTDEAGVAPWFQQDQNDVGATDKEVRTEEA